MIRVLDERVHSLLVLSTLVGEHQEAPREQLTSEIQSR